MSDGEMSPMQQSLLDAVLKLTEETSTLRGQLEGLVTYDRAQEQHRLTKSEIRDQVTSLESRLSHQINGVCDAAKEGRMDLKSDLEREMIFKAQEAAERVVKDAFERDTKSMARARMIMLVGGGVGVTSAIPAIWKWLFGG